LAPRELLHGPQSPRPIHVSAHIPLRLEGGLFRPGSGRQIAYLTRNAQGLWDRVWRRGGLLLSAPLRPLIGIASPGLATRLQHAWLRGFSRDRLDFLGDEFFLRNVLPHLEQVQVPEGTTVLVSSMLEHVVRPIAQHLGIPHILCNRLEFRGLHTTGRLQEPVIPRRGAVDLTHAAVLDAIRPAERPQPRNGRAVVAYDGAVQDRPFSVQKTLAGKHILLIGSTGFIGKVWLANLLHDLPSIGRLYVLVRPKGTRTAQERFDTVVRESPLFKDLDETVLRDKVEVVAGDMCEPGLGLDDATRERMKGCLDLIVNSGGVTEFNGDLRTVLSVNVESTVLILDFLRECGGRVGLLHLSTCFVAGSKPGRILEEPVPNFNPAGVKGFDAEEERLHLREICRIAEGENTRRKELRDRLSRIGMKRANHFGWQNTYTFTKSLAESLIESRGADLPIAIVRPSIVETSTRQPFSGWNEGINTSAPLSYLLGTSFRQIPVHRRKQLDIVPVDLVTRGMMLISAAIVQRTHGRLYQLATSTSNPLGIRRSVELTSLAHRAYDNSLRGLQRWVKKLYESVPVSERRYRALSVPRQKAIVHALRKVTPVLREKLRRIERDLDRVEKVIDLYEPFILRNDHTFEADRIELLSAALPPEDRGPFGYDASHIDWTDYWLHVHIPALRRWSFPLIEGRPLEV